jgi:hypothetical protein
VAWGGAIAALFVATLAAKVAADAGGPRGLLTAIQVATVGLLGFLAADPLRPALAGRAPRDSPVARHPDRADRLREVGGDGWQAFVIVRSVLLDHDLDSANDYAGLRAAGGADSRRPSPRAISRSGLRSSGRRRSSSPISVRRWPRPWARTCPRTVFSVPYRSGVTAGTYAYGVIALLLLESELRRAGGRGGRLVAVLAIWLATPLHFYMTANPAMAHGASVFVATAFVVAWLRLREQDAASGRAWAMVGLLGD